ncbi:tenascin-like [Penaeus vannamei]|uniref:tenascin-like n=1 Tax=Penaeus vannamei TaxID=6689 RepID=UPI00387F768E
MRMRYFWMLGFVTTAAALLLEAEEAQGKGVEEEVDLGPCEEAKGSCVPERNCSRIISGAECPEGNVCCTGKWITETIETREATCELTRKCRRANGRCTGKGCRRQERELPGGCGRSHCKCCIRDEKCKPKKQCKWKGRYCTTGKCKNNERVIKRACQEKKCRCCAPGRVCKKKTKCKENKGSCRQGRCKSYEKEIYEGCKGLRCRCCALDVVTTTVPVTTAPVTTTTVPVTTTTVPVTTTTTPVTTTVPGTTIVAETSFPEGWG